MNACIELADFIEYGQCIFYITYFLSLAKSLAYTIFEYDKKKRCGVSIGIYVG